MPLDSSMMFGRRFLHDLLSRDYLFPFWPHWLTTKPFFNDEHHLTDDI
jgi:hypothetical protein